MADGVPGGISRCFRYHELQIHFSFREYRRANLAAKEFAAGVKQLSFASRFLLY